MKLHVWSILLKSGIALSCLASTNSIQAQVVPDRSLPNNSRATSQGNTITITGGTKAGSNLFHSFAQFSIPTSVTAYFNNTLDIQNIISRVTGSSISNIYGLIKANGTNLFLINPNGIVFGPNSSLNIGGSFVASTASSLRFADGTQFSATAPQTTLLLTISVPTGLQFGTNAGSILNQSTAIVTDTSGGESTVGLQVQRGKTLALIGGDVRLEGGYLTAEEGRIELGSVVGTGQVSLKPMEKGWALGYEGVQNFKDIQLSQGAMVNASGESGGDIQVHGRHLILNGGSQIFSETLGAVPGENLEVTASDSIELSGTSPDDVTINSGLFTITQGSGKAGDITIKTGNLIIQNQAGVSTEATSKATGGAGNLSVFATGSVKLTDAFLLTQTSSGGNGGDLTLETGQMILQNGGRISSTSFAQGNSGNIRVNASNAINIFGVSPTAGSSSGLFARTFGEGQGGNITINTRDFRVADGGLIDALTTAKGNGGNVTVTAKTFEALNGGQVLTSTRSSGNAGNITLDATNSINLSGSDLTFVARIASFSEGVDNEGPTSGLFANTEQGSTGNGGNLTLKTRQLNTINGASLTVSSQGTGGDAGDLQVKAGSIRLDNGQLTATSASGKGGNITLQAQDLLLMRHNSQISTTAGLADAGGNGGNITINSPFIVAVPSENSDIKADAFLGQGGKLTINSQRIFGLAVLNLKDLQTLLGTNDPTKLDPINLPSNDITAISQTNPSLSGQVTINTLDINPTLGLVNLPVKPVNVSGLIAQGCPTDVGPRGSKFVVTGHGGLPPTPREALSSEQPLADLGTPVQGQENRASAFTSSNPTNSEPEQIVEATGWVTNAKGKVVLVANPPTFTPNIPWMAPTTCHS